MKKVLSTLLSASPLLAMAQDGYRYYDGVSLGSMDWDETSTLLTLWIGCIAVGGLILYVIHLTFPDGEITNWFFKCIGIAGYLLLVAAFLISFPLICGWPPFILIIIAIVLGIALVSAYRDKHRK